ncbi:pilus assembly PilX N-terminal domain-containing protein [Acidobacteria bacterium AH-259-A15]|nr:pilus assembly PilX N-terminal domain-containing protein [Acidobacteria bacterium AH-259-A15]
MYEKLRRQQCLTRDRSEQGVALVTAILCMMLISVLGLALTTIGIVATTAAKNERQMSEAFYIAESGLGHGRALIEANGTTNFDTLLQAGDGTACNGDELSGVPSDPIPSAGLSFGGGRYEVSICDDHAYESSTTDPPDLPDTDPNNDANGFVRIVSTGFGADGAKATVESSLLVSTLPAIVVNGNLKINGDPTIIGDGGAVHANGDMDISGDPCFEQYYSSTGSINESGNPDTGSGCAGAGGFDSPPDKRPTEASVSIPDIDPTILKPLADWILHDDGTITDQAGNPQGGGAWSGWSFDAGKKEWKLGSNSTPAGTYYSEGSIVISGNPGIGDPAMSLTWIAEGYMDISGNPWFQADLTTGGVSYAVVTGHDYKLGGNPQITGVAYARQQIGISGNPAMIISGQIIALDDADTDYPNPGDENPVVRLSGGYMEISGNPTIDSDVTGVITKRVQRGWRECRGSGADPCS